MSMHGEPSSLEETVSVKIKRRILPLRMAGWLIAYIDRFNIGFAALQMNGALRLSATALGFAAGLSFIGYARTGGFAAAYGIAGILMAAGAITVLLTRERREPSIQGEPVVVN